MTVLRILSAVLLTAALAVPALAVEPDEMLDDPVLEARAREISKQVRCVVCQNQDIDSSASGVARDLRLLVRERLVAGDTNREVLDYLVARYGSFVLFKPPWKASTYALWLGPFVILALGGVAVAVAVRRGAGRGAAGRDALSPEEEAAAAALLADYGQGDGK